MWYKCVKKRGKVYEENLISFIGCLHSWRMLQWRDKRQLNLHDGR